MKCAVCGGKTETRDSRPKNGYTRRRLYCDKCKISIHTREYPEERIKQLLEVERICKALTLMLRDENE